MNFSFPALSLKTKLVAFIVTLLALTLIAQVLVSIQTQNAVVAATEANVKDLASAIQISIKELTAVGSTDRDKLENYVRHLHHRGLEVSIASSDELILNSSNPNLIGSSLNPESKELVITERLGHPAGSRFAPTYDLGLGKRERTVYLIPVVVQDHLMGYVQVIAQFGDFTQLLRENRARTIALASLIFAAGIIFSYALASRYVGPIHEVAAAAQNIAARGLEPVPEAPRRDEIGLLTRSFNEMVSQLGRAREREAELNRLERFTALGQLAGGLAHEIKNPLNFISLAVDSLRARYAPQIASDRDNFMRQIAMIKDEIRRLSELTQSFLIYGRPIEIHPAPTDVRAIVQDVLTLSESKLRSQGIIVRENGGEVPTLLNVDGEKIRTCFVNVVANATQAMPDGGALDIGFHQNNGSLVIDFSDSGAGIEPEVARRVFEPFFTTKREGIGIGLFLSKAIVEKHGGAIAIAPNPAGKGTTVTFTFPSAGIHRDS